ncbi:MAG: DUF4870 domain-containing protein [Terriglobales bacterium]
MAQEPELPIPSPDERSLASLAHALQIVGWFIAPLIIFLIRRDSKFVSFHALQALLLQIVYMITFGLMMVLMFVTLFVPLMMKESERGRSEEDPAAVEQKAEEKTEDRAENKASNEKPGNGASKTEPAEPKTPQKKPAKRKSEPPPFWFFVFFPVFWLFHMATWVLLLVVAIVYCIKASRGEWAAYPVVGGWARRLLK